MTRLAGDIAIAAGTCLIVFAGLVIAGLGAAAWWLHLE